MTGNGAGPEEVEEWTDGSRIDERAAGSTRKKGMYLGSLATVTDTEEVGVMLAWEECDVVALDSQGAIQRIYNLQYKLTISGPEVVDRREAKRANGGASENTDVGARAPRSRGK